MVVKGVVEDEWLGLFGDADDIALLRMKLHLLLLFPLLQLVQVTLEGFGVILCGHSHVHDGVVCEESHLRLESIRQVIDVDKEQDWPNHGPLGYATGHLLPLTHLTFTDYSLDSVRKEALHPLVDLSCDAILMKLLDESIMRNFIKCFCEIHYDDICLLTIVEVVENVLREGK